MSTLRVAMRPVHDAAILVPRVFAAEGDEIAFVQTLDARRQIDVVRNQHGLAGIELEDEALLLAAVAIIPHHRDDAPTALPLHPTPAIGISLRPPPLGLPRPPPLHPPPTLHPHHPPPTPHPPPHPHHIFPNQP